MKTPQVNTASSIVMNNPQVKMSYTFMFILGVVQLVATSILTKATASPHFVHLVFTFCFPSCVHAAIPAHFNGTDHFIPLDHAPF